MAIESIRDFASENHNTSGSKLQMGYATRQAMCTYLLIGKNLQVTLTRYLEQ